MSLKKLIIGAGIIILIHILSLIFVNYEIKSFVRNSGLDKVKDINIVYQDNVRDLKVFDVKHGDGMDCVMGCIYSHAVGIQYKEKIGWINEITTFDDLIPVLNSDQESDSDIKNRKRNNKNMYIFDESDAYLLSNDFLISIREHDKHIHDYYILPMFSKQLSNTSTDTQPSIKQTTLTELNNHISVDETHRSPCTSSIDYSPSERNNDQGYTIFVNESDPQIPIEVCFSGEVINRLSKSDFWLIDQSTEEPFTVEDILPTDTSKIYAYDDTSFYIKGEPVYSTSDGSFKIFYGNNGHQFLRIGSYIYGFYPIGLGASSLHKIKDVDINTFEYIGGCYGKDKNNVYCSHSSDPLPEASPLSFGISKFSLYGQALGIDGEKLFFKQTWLNGLEASETTLDDNSIYDSDTLWYITGGCNWPYFKKGDLDKKDSYYNC